MPKDGTDERPEREKVLNAIAALRARASDKRKAAQDIQLESAGLDHAADLLEQLLDSAPAERAYDTVPIAAVAEALSDAGAEAEAAAFAEEERPLPPPMRMVRDTPAPAEPEGEKPKATARVLALLQGSDHALDFETIRTSLNMRFSTCRRAVDQCVEAGQVVRYGPARGRGVSYWAAQRAPFETAAATEPAPEPAPAPPPPVAAKAAPAPRAAVERDPRTLPGRIVLEALNDAGDAGMTPTTLREETGLEPSPFRMIMDPMVAQNLVSRLSGQGQVRYVVLEKGRAELKRLRDLSS